PRDAARDPGRRSAVADGGGRRRGDVVRRLRRADQGGLRAGGAAAELAGGDRGHVRRRRRDAAVLRGRRRGPRVAGMGAVGGAGMAARRSAELIAAFLAIMYFPYVLACLFGGLGGGAPPAVVWTGVALGLIALAGAAAVTLVPGDLERRARKHAAGHGRGA